MKAQTFRAKTQAKANATLTATAMVATLLLTVVAPGAAFAAAAGDWSAPVQISQTGKYADDLQVTSAADGSITALWISDGTNRIVQVSNSFDHGATWSTPIEISHASLDSFSPALVIAADGTVTAAWTSVDSGAYSVHTSTSTDRGVTWRASQMLSTAGKKSSTPQLAAAADGSVTVVWYGTKGTVDTIQARTSADRGANWSATSALSDSSTNSTAPRIAIAKDGTAIVAWLSEETFDVVRTSASDNQGSTWSTPIAVSSTTVRADDQRLVAAPDGSITMVWASKDGSNNPIAASTSTDPGVSWGAPVEVSGAISAGNTPELVVASDGALTVIWRGDNSAGDKMVQSSTSTNRGASWSTPFTLSPANSKSPSPQLAVTASGTLTAVWEIDNGSLRAVQTSTSTDQGTSWSASVGLGRAGVDNDEAHIVAAADNALITFWSTYVGGDNLLDSSFRHSVPAITSAAPPSPAAGSSYSFTVTATGFPSPTFTVSSGALPAGLTLSSAGVISGTPTAAGSSKFAITASNGVSPAVTSSYTLTTTAGLPATGSVILIPLAVGAVLALLLGAVLVGVTRSRRSRR